MAAHAMDSQLIHVVALLGAAVVIVPLFRRLGLGSVLGYLIAGLVIGPFGLGWFTDAEAILHVAELGVVMFLFVIGLEMRPSHLWCLRRYIFGLGTFQVVASTAALFGIGLLLGFSLRTALIAATGFVLTSTAIVMQLLSERGDLAQTGGQKIVSILLLEDLLLVPLLLMVAWMSSDGEPVSASQRWLAILSGLAALVALLAAGRWLLNPLFRALAGAKAREVLTAGALLVVLGAALLMQLGGLSMAMGAFIAGVLLSESSFRHQLEADVEPFRGILLGLFFLGVGMTVNVDTVSSGWQAILWGVVGFMLVKGTCIYVVARWTKSSHEEALDRATLMAQGGEFAFVLYGAAALGGIITDEARSHLISIVVLSMALTPLVTTFVHLLMKRRPRKQQADGNVPYKVGGSVLMVGFGRFGQVVSQSLLARDVDVTVIDTDLSMIEAASEFGFKIYYGDGTRLDVLEAAGAADARIIAVCVDDRQTSRMIVDLVTSQFSAATLMVRTYDREDSLLMVGKGVHIHMRETFESALRFGSIALRQLGVPSGQVRRTANSVRQRDAERFASELAGSDWASAGAGSFVRRPQPTPFVQPRREGKDLSSERDDPTESP